MKPILILLTITMLSQSVWAEALQGSKAGDVETGVSLLDLFGQQTEAANAIYRAAYGILSKPGATCADLAGDVAFQELCDKHGMTHLGGPMLGCVSAEGARVWLRTRRPATVEIRVKAGDAEKQFGPVESTLKSDLVAVVPVSGLSPGTRYPYRVLVDGKPVPIPESAIIATAPPPTTTGKVRIAFGSCFHRWGLGNAQQADRIRSRQPAAMLLLGDIAVQDRNNHLGMHRADYVLRDLHPAWNSLVSSVPIYATWDDHDYFDNDRAGIPRGYTLKDKQNVCDIWQQAWNNPSYGFDDERRGVFTRTRIGPCDVIMVDNRYFRDKETGAFLGEGQMQWLKQSLLDCKGPFIILSCGTMWSDYVSNGKDSWGRLDPAGREEIFGLIEKNHIGGVLLISGDRHGARGFTIPRPSGFSFYEFEAGSLGGRTGPPTTSPKWTTQLYGISGQYAFGEFSIDATLADPEVTFRLIRDDGKVIYELTLKRSQLTPRGQRTEQP